MWAAFFLIWEKIEVTFTKTYIKSLCSILWCNEKCKGQIRKKIIDQNNQLCQSLKSNKINEIPIFKELALINMEIMQEWNGNYSSKYSNWIVPTHINEGASVILLKILTYGEKLIFHIEQLWNKHM